MKDGVSSPFDKEIMDPWPLAMDKKGISNQLVKVGRKGVVFSINYNPLGLSHSDDRDNIT